MKYFTISELTRSATAEARKINNTPNALQSEALVELINKVLDPLREKYGKPITVNCGFRCATLNKAVGGVPASQHLKGEAADITTGSKEGNKILFDLIKKELPYDQVINEKNYSWIHVSYKKSGNRKQSLAL